jgi:hypothetical protein
VSKMIVLLPRSECVVPVQCAAPGLRFLQARLRDIAAGVHMANGVAEIRPNQPFTVRVVNTSMKIHRLPKGMVLGHALPHPTSMMALIADTDVVAYRRQKLRHRRRISPSVIKNKLQNCLRWSIG